MSNTGWICPRCQKVHAPFVSACSCDGPVSPYRDADLKQPVPPIRIPGVRPGWEPLPSVATPMPICGCTGPCANAACPHRPVVTC